MTSTARDFLNQLANLYKERYKERWKIELDFLAIKTHMGMEMLR